ncbi:ABC transporter substrate-binding protein [Mangrovihabitans endophyticus]|uniref:Nitrate ABC transporter substrate-binding protein n=1 Tax=Mangrovihabitans endophyticus TaxID=1751298 RepID=A0A8J3C4J8_9ACTN|nr:ABC transporter substrate-binding protein [Mangrovihabitans endophyticus]GGL07557.1 nitrate ABC transporter substrate-binding protein [Mangrovihabitans endophyticus]
MNNRRSGRAHRDNGTRVGRREVLRLGLAGAGAAALPAGLGGCFLADDDQKTAPGRAAPIRFAFAPDAIWDFMTDRGMIDAWEKDTGLVVQTSSTWDEFTFFAGGHGDIVSTATYELPLLEKQTGITTVTFGKYNLLRITPVTRADAPYRTLADIPKGAKIALPSAVSSTLLWGMFAKELHGLDFRVGRGDFDLVVEDHFVMAEHVDRGEVEAALVIPEAAIGLLREGKLKVMYDNRLPYEIYGSICNCTHKGIMGNLFTATRSWYDDHVDEATAFADLWQRGIDLWRDNQAAIIKNYPQHFSIEKEADVTAMQQYLAQHDWFVDTVRLDQPWIEREMRLYDLMKRSGFMAGDAPVPRFEATGS